MSALHCPNYRATVIQTAEWRQTESAVYITNVLNFAITELIMDRNRELYAQMLSSKPINALFAFTSRLTMETESYLKSWCVRVISWGWHLWWTCPLSWTALQTWTQVFVFDLPPAVWCINSLLSADALINESLHFSCWGAALWDSLSNLAQQPLLHNVTL